MRRPLARLAVIVMCLSSSPAHPQSSEIELLRPTPVDAPTRTLIDRLRSDPELIALRIGVKESDLPAGAEFVNALQGEKLRIGLVSLDLLIADKLIANQALTSSILQPAQIADVQDLFAQQDDVLGDAILAEVGRDRRLVPLAYWSRGQTAIVTRRPIRSAGDFQGRKIRSAFSPASDTIVAHLGATTVRIPAGEVLPALERGLFDTVEFTTSAASNAVRLGADIGAIATQFRPIIGFLIAGSEGWGRLSEAQKVAIERAARRADVAAREATLKSETELLAAASARNITVVNLAETDMAGFRQAGATAVTQKFGASGEQIFRDVARIRDATVDLRMMQLSAPKTVTPIAGPAPGRPAPPPVPVLFITDRNDDGGPSVATRFGRNQTATVELTCGRIVYSPVAGRRLGGNFAGPLAFGDKTPTGQDNCIDFIVAGMKQSNKTRLLLFIHGYNNSFEDAVRRTITSASDIEYDGAVLVWSWPSAGTVGGYFRDSESARRTQRFLWRFLSALLTRPEVGRLDILAHSMGTRIAMFLLDRLSDTGATKIGDVVLAAADEAKTIMGDTIADIVRFAPRLGRTRTLYAAAHDRPLLTSRLLHDTERAGIGGDRLLVTRGLESVDATAVEAGFWKSLVTGSHAHVFQVPEAINDLKALLKDGKTADQRKLTRRGRNGLPYWLIPE